MTRPLWWEGVEAPLPSTTPLPARADVVIVGGGYTGLWTAYHLLGQRPDSSVLVLEAEHVGFGASGRNGGWVSPLFPVAADALAVRHGREAARAMLTHLIETVDEVGEVCREEGIDADFVKGGTLVLARGEAQAARARAEVATGLPWGIGTRWLGRAETLERLTAADTPGRRVLGATSNPHCARVQPRALADGLAAAVRRRGGTIIEGCRVTDVGPGATGHRVTLADGRSVVAESLIRATEAWTATLPRLRRRLAPIYSLMVATEPLSPAQWERIGLAGREVFSDHGHVRIYGQRTRDDRIAFGGRGAPYHFASTIRPGHDEEPAVFDALHRLLDELFPQVALRFSHAWGGPLGVPRDWHPSVGYDPASRVGWGGGYVGDGVAASALAGRTLADLVTGAPTPRTELPWVGHRSPSWEPEPLRWTGINAGLRAADLADREERRTGRPARLGPVLDRLTGQ